MIFLGIAGWYGPAHAGTDLDISVADVKITVPGEYRITGVTDIHTIQVGATGPVRVILDNVSIDLTASGGCPVAAGGDSVTVLLNGVNTLRAGGDGKSGMAMGSHTHLDDYVATSGDDGKVGVLTAYGGLYGAGMEGEPIFDGGHWIVNGGIRTGMIMNGGFVEVTGGSWSAGIGGNENQDGGVSVINGGKLYVNGGSYGAAIGGGYLGSGNSLTINGGYVTATGGSYASGIGGGEGGNGGSLIMTGGTLEVFGDSHATAIGSGQHGASEGTLTITGGNIGRPAGAIPASRTNGVNPVYLLRIGGFGILAQ